VLAVATTVLALPHARAPGLFYDEAVHAGAAKDFVSGHGSKHYPGYHSIDLGDRPLPLFIQKYCGALKAWMLVPAFALGGFSLAVFRLASLAWGLLALLLFMLWVNRWQGIRLAIVAGLGGETGHQPPEWPEKVQTFLAMYDGSYFRRVMACGGVFTAVFLAAARALPPDQVEIREHRDRENEITFYSIRFVRRWDEDEGTARTGSPPRL